MTRAERVAAGAFVAVALLVAGCAVTPDIILRDSAGRETKRWVNGTPTSCSRSRPGW
jgi:hypothetical protein